MKAFRIVEPGRTEQVEAPEPVVGPGELRLRVLANGLCHSDLFIRNLPVNLPGVTLPVTMGHEIAGEVIEIGPGVTGWSVGDRAVAHPMRGCGACDPCLEGSENLCRVGYTGVGVHFDGGLAEQVALPARHLVPIGDLDPVVAAPLADAGTTSFHAVDRVRTQLDPRGVALVIGVGGLGHMALQVIKATSAARVIAVDTSPDALDLARRLGADEAHLAGPEAAEAIKASTGPNGVTAALDFVGADATLALAAAVVRRGGAIAVAGQGSGTITFTSAINGVIDREVAVFQTSAGSLHDLRAVIALGRRGLIAPEVTRYSLDDAGAALDELDAGKVVGRAVVVP